MIKIEQLKHEVVFQVSKVCIEIQRGFSGETAGQFVILAIQQEPCKQSREGPARHTVQRREAEWERPHLEQKLLTTQRRCGGDLRGDFSGC